MAASGTASVSRMLRAPSVRTAAVIAAAQPSSFLTAHRGSLKTCVAAAGPGRLFILINEIPAEYSTQLKLFMHSPALNTSGGGVRSRVRRQATTPKSVSVDVTN